MRTHHHEGAQGALQQQHCRHCEYSEHYPYGNYDTASSMKEKKKFDSFPIP